MRGDVEKGGTEQPPPVSGDCAPRPRGGTRVLRPAAALLAVICLAAGWLGGWFTHRLWSGAQPEGSVIEIREAGPHYTSLLLDCDIARQSLDFRVLKPFRERVEAVIAAATAAGRIGQASVYFRDLTNGPWFSVNPEQRFVPASLTKLPILIAFLKRAERDPSLLGREILFAPPAEDLNLRQRFQPKRALVPGTRYRVEELLERLIVGSDNNVLPALQPLLGSREVMESLSAMGIGFTRHMQDSGYISVEDYAAFFRILFNASYLSHEASEKALSFLAATEYREGIRAGLPKEVEVAHKFGEYQLPAGEQMAFQLHDCGIVYARRSPYLLCVMTRGERIEPLPGVIEEISRTVYESVLSQRPVPAAAWPGGS